MNLETLLASKKAVGGGDFDVSFGEPTGQCSSSNSTKAERICGLKQA